MFSYILVAILAYTSLLARAGPTPTAPGPGSVFNEGTNCTFSWTGDTVTGSTVWADMNVFLMSGSNLQMSFLTTVASGLDGTHEGSYSYPCPEVTPNSAIYFYEFSSPQTSDLYWTTRFAIADANGNTTPPPNSTQPDGADIPWGDGTLVNPSSAVAESPIGTAPEATSVSVAASSASSVLSSSASPSLTTSSIPVGTPAAAAASASSTVSSSGAVGNLKTDLKVWQAAIALAVTAITFGTFL